MRLTMMFVFGICAYMAAGYPLNPSFTPEAVMAYKAKADAGDAEAQYLYSCALATGEGVGMNGSQAFVYAKKAADQGYERAFRYVGLGYDENCWGIETNAVKATEYYSRFVAWAKTVVERGDADAQRALAICYRFGAGVERNMTEAVRWYRRAAESGHSRAQYNLGQCYEDGAGVETNMAEAVRWYRKAAESGSSWAQHDLGVCYAQGNGVAENKVESAEWHRKAAEQGNASSQWIMSIYYELGLGVETNKTEALKWCRKAAESGDEWCQFDMGDRYATGKGVAKDMAEAAKWFRKAAEQGRRCAQYSLGECYAKGNGVAKDMSEAVKWFRKAAEQDDEASKWALCWCYKKGVGVAKDKMEFKKWYQKCVGRGEWGMRCFVYGRELLLLSLIFILLSVGIGIYGENLESAKWVETLRVRQSARYRTYKRFEIPLMSILGLLSAGFATCGLPVPSEDMPFGLAGFLGDLNSDAAVYFWILSFASWGVALNKFLIKRHEKPTNETNRLTYSQYVKVIVVECLVNYLLGLLLVLTPLWIGCYACAVSIMVVLLIVVSCHWPTRKKYEKLLNGAPANRTVGGVDR